MESSMDIDLQVDTNNCQRKTNVIEGSGEHEVIECIANKTNLEENIDNEEREKFVIEGSDECRPYIGMEFQSEEHAYSYYNIYAKRMGFSVRKSKVYHSALKKCITSRKLLCAKEGYKGNDKRRNPLGKRYREVRTGCMAMIMVKMTDAGIWVVEKFREDHNHPLSTPSKIAEIRSRKEMSAVKKSLNNSFHKSTRTAMISNALTTLERGENVIVSQPDTCSYLKNLKKDNIGSDCMNVIESFMDRHIKEDGFFFEVELDKEYKKKNIFWADGRSRMAYQQFGDVVVIDTIYKVNTFSFTPFTGVNHHRQPILFGCALLADETEESFVWLFQTWLKAMGEKKPLSIITDQCNAMGKAIERFLLGTRHRYCMWHIEQDEIKNLNHIKQNHTNFEVDYKKCKYSKTIEEFETRWSELIGKYELEKNSWLKHMYEVREHWIPCYLRDTFWAGMTTTQRGENMDSFFDGYMNARTPLNEFVRQYDLALIHRRNQENHEDHVTLYTKPTLWSSHPLEKQVGEVYTRCLFDIFQEDFKNKEAYFAYRSQQEGSIKIYEVGKYGSDNERFSVSIDGGDGGVSCSCKKFECEGLLCSHILKVYQKTDVIKIPSKYIMTRWTMDARYTHVRLFMDESSDKHRVNTMTIWKIRETALKCIDLGIQSVEHAKVALPALTSVMEKLNSIKPEESG